MREKPLVLLIDDEEVFLEIASMKLSSGGLETLITRNITEALRKAEDLLPDLVLSDIYMPPGPNGWELALELKRNPKTKQLKIAFFSSLRDPWLEIKADREKLIAELGAVTFLSKMDDVDVLAERVWQLIKGE